MAAHPDVQGRPRRGRYEVDHGHQHGNRRDDERGDRPAQPRAHVLLVVGPGRDRPDRDRPRRGRLPLHARGPADPRLQQPADVGQHRPRRPARHRRDHRAGDEAPVRPAGVRDRAAGAPRGEARRDPARRPRQGLLHARRRRGDRERDQARPRVHRPPQDPRPLPLVPRRDARGDDADRRPAPLGERAGARRRRPLPGHPPLGRGGAAARGRGAPGPRGRHPLRGRRTRSRRSSSRRSSGRTASSSRPTATSRASARSATGTTS